MKTILAIFFCLIVNAVCKAQLKPKYNIKVVEKSKHRIHGVFYAITDKELILLKNNGDTIKLAFNSIKDLYISKRGVIFPPMVLGAGVAIVAAAEAQLPLGQAAYIVAGVPVGIAIGNIVGQLFANKRFYKGLEIADFPNIKTDLEKYTQVIYQPLTN